MIVLLLLVIVASAIAYKKTVLFSAATLMYMGNLSSGIEGIRLYYAVVLIQIVFFYLFGHYKKRKDDYPYLILIPTLIAGICYLLSSILGTIHNYAKNVVNICAWFYYPYIVWHVMSTKKDVVRYGKILTAFFFIVAGYTFIELALGQNIYALWADNAGIIAGELGGLEAGERFGFLRCNSILPYSSALGMNSSFVFFVITILVAKGFNFSTYQRVLIYLMPLCVLFCGTRSQYIVFFLCFMAIMLFKEYRRLKDVRILTIIGVITLFAFSAVFGEIIDSIIHSDSSSTGGSNMDMRLNQYAITMSYWQRFPWFGYGRNFTWEVAIPENPALLGAESIIFTQLLDHGLAGLLCFYAIGICLAICCYKHSKPLTMIPIAFIIGKTLSTVIGVDYNIPIVLCIFVIRALTLYQVPQYEIKRKKYH